MYLIGKNKITQYISQNPQARITLLTWLKEYPYREGKNLFKRSVQGCASGQSQPGIGNYVVSYKINYRAQAVLVTYVGSKEEHQAEMERKFREMQEKNPGLVRETKVAEVVIKVPQNLEKLQQVETERTGTDSTTILWLPEIDSENGQYNADQEIKSETSFITADFYESALGKVAAIFDAQPGMPEFDELTALLPVVNSYEAQALKYPPLKTFEIVNYIMDMLDLPASYVGPAAGGEDKLEQFRLGEITLPDNVLARLYNKLHICFPVSDQRFFNRDL